MNNEITFATYNVEGIQNSAKRIKFLKFLKRYATGNRFIFL